MFAYALRGVILVGVLGWYSTGVWRMIDSYFKDRFNKYLQEEYAKNPKMKRDIDTHSYANDGVDKIIETNAIKTNHRKKKINYNNNGNDEFVINNDISNSVEFNEKTLSKHSIEVDNEAASLINNENNIKIFHYSTKQKQLQSSSSLINNEPNKRISTTNKFNEKQKKVKLKKPQALYNNQRFITNKISRVDDFSEFDYDEDDKKYQKEEPGSIYIVDLPFKPKADLGHRDTITKDEYCPLNLDYDGEDCKVSTTWP